MFLAEAKLKAKGLNADGTPALSTLGGFSPASKPCSPAVVPVEDKSPKPQALKPVKKEPDNRAQVSKSPHNGSVDPQPTQFPGPLCPFCVPSLNQA